MGFVLVDDGTMDTVIKCTVCGQECRYNYDPSATEDGDDYDYDSFVEDCFTEMTDEHTCEDVDNGV